MSDEQPFRLGERVRTLYTVGSIAPSTRGTIAYAFLGARLYQVSFDGYASPQLAWQHNLALDAPEPTSTSDAA